MCLDGDGGAAAGGAGGGGVSTDRPGAGEKGPGAGAEDRPERSRAHPRGGAERRGPAQVTNTDTWFISHWNIVHVSQNVFSLLELMEVWRTLENKMCLKREETSINQ